MPKAPQARPGGYSAGQFGSPARAPQAFQRNVHNYFSGLSGQLGGQPNRGPKTGGGKRIDYGAPAPAPVDSGSGGTQQFGTWAPDVQEGQFVKDNFGRGALKGLKGLDTGGFGGMFGGTGFGGGYGGGFGGMDMMSMLMNLMGQLGNQEDQGPIRGK